MSVETPKYKLLPAVRKHLLAEFVFKKNLGDRGYDVIDGLLEQEPYNMLTNRDGEKKPSTQWRITLEQLWAMNNLAPSKGRYNFDNVFKYENHTFSRRVIYQQPVFQADLIKLLRDQFSAMKYPRMYTDTLHKFDHTDKSEYTTLLIKVKVV
jgi:hypothetical protein